MMCVLMCSSAWTQACDLRAKRWKAGVWASCQQVIRGPGFQAAQSVRRKLLNHQKAPACTNTATSGRGFVHDLRFPLCLTF